MRLSNREHESGPWRIRRIAHDFKLEDVWALPVGGRLEDFATAIEMLSSFDPSKQASLPTRALWRIRDGLGRLFGLGRISAPSGAAKDWPQVPGTTETTLERRLPDDLRGTAAHVDFGALPFDPLYRTEDEFAAEISNQTMFGVLHLAWVDQGGGHYQGQMAVYVKPRGPLGEAYMALIRPFRYLIVYPELMKQIERAWAARPVPSPA